MTAPNPLARYPLIWYTILACLIGWAFTIAHALGAGNDAGQFPLGPIIAALVVSLALGRQGMRRWWSALTSFRTAPGWYLLATVGPVVMIVLLVLANAAFGAPLPTRTDLARALTLGPALVGILIGIGVGEEAGWTAFAAPRLLERGSFLAAWLVLASIRTFWHLPLMLDGNLSVMIGVGGNFAFQFVMLWLYRRTGAWFLAAIWHTVHNVASGQFFFRLVDGVDRERLGTLLVVGYGLLALFLVMIDRIRPVEGASAKAPAATAAAIH